MKVSKVFIFIIISVVILYFLSYKTSPVLTDVQSNVLKPGKYTSLEFSELRKILPERFKYIEENSTFLNPYNSEKMDLLKSKLTNATDEEMIMLSAFTPNADLDMFRLESLKPPASTYSSFQFQQGTFGWFWIYGTFIDSLGETSSYMFYLFRIDIFNPELTAEMNLPMGSTTYYFISTGVGKGDKWEYSPFKVCRGEYEIKNDSNFSFNALDLPEGWKCNFNFNTSKNIEIYSTWKNENTTNDTSINKSHTSNGIAVNMSSVRPAFFNGKSGCAPCEGGAGTLYLSYTQLKINGTLTINDSTTSVKNGIGWIDRQWANGNVSTVSLALLNNVMSIFKSTATGLGKYVWTNLHLSDSLQYMIYNFFPLDQTLLPGTIFQTTMNRYGPDQIIWSLKGEGEVLDTVVREGIIFPIKYKLTTQDGTFILDGSKFKNSLSVDITNNFHWDGSAIIFDSTGKNQLGTGFLEANQFTDQVEYVKNELSVMGLDTNEANISLFNESGSKLPLSKGILSLLIVILIAGFFIYMLVSVFRMIIHRKKQV
ncbi:MAG TPA: lipocalin-like domain-containing protein [Ignavibacteria bacterium]|nr:lipocalin-like domain-containing protein [Ignavibacteria bacterium]